MRLKLLSVSALVLAVVLALAIAGIVTGAVPTAPTGIGADAQDLPAGPSAASASEARLEIIGQVGGFPADVAVRGDLAYLCVGMQVLALDFSAVAEPQLVAQSGPLGGDASYVRSAGDRVVVVSAWRGGDSPWHVTVLGPPSGGSLPVLGQAPIDEGGDIWEVVADGTRVVLRGDDGLTVVDVSEPADLRSQALPVPLPSPATAITGVAFVDHLLYVFMSPADQPAGLVRVLDLADPGQPRLVGEASIGGRLPTVGGDTLLAMSPAGSPSGLGLQVIDVSAPYSPRLQSTTPITDDIAAGVSVVHVTGGAVIMGDFGQVLVYDLVDPANPERVATQAHNTPLLAATGDGHRLFAVGGIAVPGRMTLAVLDATDLSRLPTIGHYLVPPSQVAGISIDDDALYLTGRQALSGDRGALWAVDITDPARPLPRESLPIPVGNSKIARVGAYLYASGVGTGLHVVETSDDGRLLARGIAPGGANSRVVAAGNGYAYVQDRDSLRRQLLAIDVSKPDAPAALPPAGPVEEFLTLRLAGSYLYGADVYHGFVTLDAREPWQPRLARRDEVTEGLTHHPSAVDSDGSRAVAAVGSSLRLFDVSTVSGTRQIGSTKVQEWVRAVALTGNTAWALGSSSLTAVDIANPEMPTVLASLPLPFDARLGGSDRVDIAVLGSLVLVATSQNDGALLIRFTPASLPDPSPTPEPPAVRGSHRAHLPLTLRSGFAGGRAGRLDPVGLWPGAVGAVAVDGGVVLGLRQVGPGSPWLDVVTLSFADPSAPVLLGVSEAFQLRDVGRFGPSMAAANRYAYVPAGFGGGLIVVDVRNVRDPKVVVQAIDGNQWHELTLSGRNGYLFGSHGDVSVLDLTNPAAPRPIGVMHYPAGSDGQGQVQAVVVSGSLALVAYISDGWSEPGLAAWDVSNPAHPRLLSQTLQGIGVAAIAMDGHLAYVSPAQDQPVGRPLTPGVLVLDVSDPTRIRELGHRLDGGLSEIRSLVLLDPQTLLLGAMSLSSGPRGAYVWDVSESALPRQLDAVEVFGGSAVATDRVYIPNYGGAVGGWKGPGIMAFDWVSRR